MVLNVNQKYVIIFFKNNVILRGVQNMEERYVSSQKAGIIGIIGNIFLT